MRISSQNNQFIFGFGVDFIKRELEEQFQKLMEKNFVQYDSVVDYINSTIKEIVIPGASYTTQKQVLKRGKKIEWKDSSSVFDTFSNEIDITFRSVDSYLNYFILLQILTEFYEDNLTRQIDHLKLAILDKDGTLIYTVYFNEVIFKSISEVRLGYQQYDVNEKPFTISFVYNFIDIRWELDDENYNTSKSIFDIPIDFKPGTLDKI